MKVIAHFEAPRDTAEGIKEYFMASVDSAFEDSMKEITHYSTESDTHTGVVVFSTDADIDAMLTETKWYLGGGFGGCKTLVAPENQSVEEGSIVV